MRDKIREVKFNRQILKFVYRDDSDTSVIDEFFVDRMYRSIKSQIQNSKFQILDIGAHIGAFSIYASAINPQSQIIAIEPEPTNFALLKANLMLNECKNVKPVRAALVSDDASSTNLYLSKNTHNHSTLSLRGSRQADEAISSSITVPAINLDQLMKQHKIKKIGLLKMDIEGAEFDVIKAPARNASNLPASPCEAWRAGLACVAGGLKHKNFKTIGNMVIEYHESNNHKRLELEALIRSHGFSVEHFPNRFDKRFGLLVCRNKR